eukprot:3760144-Alexandrium_andersonii.AAC.1
MPALAHHHREIPLLTLTSQCDSRLLTALVCSACALRCVVHPRAQSKRLVCRERACRTRAFRAALRICPPLATCRERSPAPHCVPAACRALRVACALALT